MSEDIISCLYLSTFNFDNLRHGKRNVCTNKP
jgi:hypothetical protein